MFNKNKAENMHTNTLYEPPSSAKLKLKQLLIYTLFVNLAPSVGKQPLRIDVMITEAELRGEVIITSFLRGVYPLKNPSWHCAGTISQTTCHEEY